MVLVGILDWGLGHASRMVPVIRYLLQFQCQILIAATGRQRRLLELEFPGQTFLSPPEYAVKYNAPGGNLVFGLMGQLPRLLGVIRRERQWVNQICNEYKVDAIISDNRYGFHSKGVHSVFITHQLAPISGLGMLADNIVQNLHTRAVSRFQECWVPDLEKDGLAGKLSHPTGKPLPVQYIGPLSRFHSIDHVKPSRGKLLLLLSGPEPARSRFEESLLGQLANYQGEYTLVRGLPGGDGRTLPQALDHASSAELNRMILEAGMIVCRSGYTTIMDLVCLSRTALLIPTPGQTEQEYLGHHLSEKGYFLTVAEKDLDLRQELQRLHNFAPSIPREGLNGYKAALEGLLDKIK